ncbi:MAG: hypothetical protein CMP59_12930 [Flavobacteriales bacterium]|nr:hypothetical protein [Flavobacteriales bacterium]
MKLRYILSIGIALALTQGVFARGGEKKDEGKKPNERPLLAAGCTPANRLIYLEYNNVRTRVETGGLWWQDRQNSSADYEVPRGSNSYAIYAGGLWLAGTDVNGQLKAAVSKFGQGVDYYTGPLNNDGTAEIDDIRCNTWDRFFEISRSEVEEFVLYNSSSDEDRAELFPNGYEVPQSIREWPGDGLANSTAADNALLADKLAPFIDVNQDGIYDWRDGDYPFYDLGASLNSNINDSSLINSDGVIDCRATRVDRSESAGRPLFGDKTYWWIFNDKGNLHTESNAPSIGMEIHAQAFAFATNDEVNDMTFYNFELINRSTFTLTDTYFASYVDSDLGNPGDDYVGCDVERGFGYCYNGDEFDEDFQGQTGYGATPAVIGIDFFEGPYQDFDGINNNVGIRPGEALNGLGYFDPNSAEPDTIVDNERFGMRRFVYYNIGGGQNGDPTLAIHYYNYMRGIWQNGQPMSHGGNGLNSAGVEGIPTAFMFPGDSDPLHWGTVDDQGIPVIPVNNNWTEDNPGGGEDANPPGDRRFLQSAGPFTLEPGNVNDITVGVVFGQAETGGRLASLNVAFTADNKAQALFDNCFQVLDGPDAPDLTIQELDKELIFYLTNSELSNNFNEEYEEEDPNIITPDTVLDQGITYDNKYRFQGYQVFQLSAEDVSINDIMDLSRARLVFQCDIVDRDTTLVNYIFDEQLQANIPQVMVEGANDGITHSFRITEDQFASGNARLINYKTYYYIAIAYATNNYKRYAQDVAPDPGNPLTPASDGQKVPYLASRQSATGGQIDPVTAIPHRPVYESNGTVVNARYGDLVGVTRWQGTGNGGNGLELTDETVNRLMEDKDWESGEVPVQLTYRLGTSPINVKVVDPLSIIDGDFVMKFVNNEPGELILDDTARWELALNGTDTVRSDRSIGSLNEQLLIGTTNNWGLSVEIGQTRLAGPDAQGEIRARNNGYIGATATFPGQVNWLSGIPDTDGNSPFNWILSGSVSGSGDQQYGDRQNANNDYIDPREDYEAILGGTWSPYNLVGYGRISGGNLFVNKPGFNKPAVEGAALRYINSILVVFTPDKSKWTRCPVVETQEELAKSTDGTDWMNVRPAVSIDKDGVPFDTSGLGLSPSDPVATLLAAGSADENDGNYISPFGMGWFPGYAINVETGERMNVVYGEDTWFGVDNGADMQWNPTSTIATGAGVVDNIWGGKHFTYFFRKTTALEREENSILDFSANFRMVEYDGGAKLYQMLRTANLQQFAWQACSWVTMPLLVPGTQLLQSEVKVNIQVSKPYEFMNTNVNDTLGSGAIDSTLANQGRPVYTFATRGFAVQKGNTEALEDALVDINVVPNPYYAISEYEGSALDNVVKITNLPQTCTIRIYNMSGTLIRSYNKADPQNFLDWDLNNQAGIPISSGVYLIHVEVPNVGEKILKWFGVTRPVDLDNF